MPPKVGRRKTSARGLPPGPPPGQKLELERELELELESDIKDALNTEEDEEEKFWRIAVIFGKLKKIKEKAEEQTTLYPETKIFGQYTYSKLNKIVEELGRIMEDYSTANDRSLEMVEKIKSLDSKFDPAQSAQIFSDIRVLKQEAIGVFRGVFGEEAGGQVPQKAGGYKKRPQKSRKSKKKSRKKRRKNKSKRKKRTKGKRSKRR